MSYKYSFDSRSVGDTWFWKESFEFFLTGLRRLRELLDAWNAREQVPPYVDEVRDLTQMIEWGTERVSKVSQHGDIWVRGRRGRG